MLRIKGKFNSLTGVSYIGLIGCGSILFLLFTAFILMPSFAENQATATNNDSEISTYSTITTPSVSISLPDSIAFSAVVPTPDGSTTTASTSFSVTTTESDGYSLYLYSDGDGSLKNSNPANISSIIATQGDVGLTLSSLESNTWGYNLGTTAPDDNTTYTAVPTDNTAPIQTKDTSSTGSANDTYTLAFGAKVDSSIPSGAYSNTLTVAVVALPQVIIADELPSGIDPDVYTPTNPGVVDVYPTTGWGDDVIAIISDGQFTDVTSVTIGGTDCEPYQVVNEYLIACKLPAKAASTDNGYEVAVTTSTGNIDMHNFTVRYFDPASTTSMQSFTEATCGSMDVGDIVPLVDERNGQVYRVKKMQDNKCWMVDNIKYLGEDIAISNSDGTSGIIYNNVSDSYNTIDGTTDVTTNPQNWDKAFYNNPMGEEYCYSTGLSASYTKCGYYYNWYAATAGEGVYDITTNGTNLANSVCPTNWRLPTMTSNGVTSTGNGSSSNTADFPVLNASMSAGVLAMGSTANYPAGWLFEGAWSGLLSGSRGIGFGSLGDTGLYWSSTAYYSSNADYLSQSARILRFTNENTVQFTYIGKKWAGYPVRCVIGENKNIIITFDGNGADTGSMSQQQMMAGAKGTLNANEFERLGYVFDSWNTAANGSGTSYADEASYTAPAESVTLYAQWRLPINHLGDVTYMQDLTATHCSTSENGATATLIDRRDNNSYTVAKINGNCWMTQNLRIAGGTTLTSSTSNVASNYTIPTTDLTNGASQTEGKVHNSGNTSQGYWYNFCAASAGTVCAEVWGGDEESFDAIYDICPKGWRLPTEPETDKLDGTYYVAAFSPVLGSYWGSQYREDEAGWWTSTATSTGHSYLGYDDGELNTWHAGTGVLNYNGFYVRCVKSD